jgi:hypothetical protein
MNLKGHVAFAPLSQLCRTETQTALKGQHLEAQGWLSFLQTTLGKMAFEVNPERVE